jgi:hypothetical protein
MEGWLVALIILLVIMAVAAIFFAVVVLSVKKKPGHERPPRSPILFPLTSKSTIIQMVASEPSLHADHNNAIDVMSTKAEPTPEIASGLVEAIELPVQKNATVTTSGQQSAFGSNNQQSSASTGSSVTSFMESVAPSQCTTAESAVSHESREKDKDSVSAGSSIITQCTYDSDQMSAASKKTAESVDDKQDSVESEEPVKKVKSPPPKEKHQHVHGKVRKEPPAPSIISTEQTEQPGSEKSADGDEIRGSPEQEEVSNNNKKAVNDEDSDDSSSDDCEFCLAERMQKARLQQQKQQ